MNEWLRVEGLSKHYGRLAALTDVGFSIRPGEILGLIGPNGAGKTTLFECMAGVLPWPAQPVKWALDFAIGFFGGRANLLQDVIDRLGLAPLLKHPTGTLSKGQRKRVMLAIGLLTRQPVLLADEPFDGLDLRQSREVAATLRAHASRGRTLFLSIHQIADAARICDRFVLLSGGRVCGEGTLEDLTAHARTRGPAPPRRDLEEVFLALT